MNVFKNIFYWVYRRQRTRYGETESAIVGILALSILIGINLKSFQMLFNYVDLLPEFFNSNFEAALSGLLIMMCLGIYIFSTKCHLKIENQTTVISSRRHLFEKAIMISYILATFVFFFLMVRLIHS
jgi:hypothetical protein